MLGREPRRRAKLGGLSARAQPSSQIEMRQPQGKLRRKPQSTKLDIEIPDGVHGTLTLALTGRGKRMRAVGPVQWVVRRFAWPHALPTTQRVSFGMRRTPAAFRYLPITCATISQIVSR